MRDRTSGADLLQVAREALTAEILPGLAGRQRYAALMVANALKMVERELSMSGRSQAADLAVQELAGHDGSSNDGPLRASCRAIRTGRHDGDAKLYAALYAQVITGVAITRPEILTPDERGQDLQ